MLVVVFFITACSAPSVKKPASILVEPSVEAKRPACLSVQDGDRHVEFTGTNLVLAEIGQPQPLALNDGDPVMCEKLEIIRDAKTPAVFIQYRTPAAGTPLGLSETKIAIASIQNANWIFAPFLVERRIHRRNRFEIEPRASYEWSDDHGHAVLTVTDLFSKTSKTIRP